MRAKAGHQVEQRLRRRKNESLRDVRVLDAAAGPTLARLDSMGLVAREREREKEKKREDQQEVEEKGTKKS